MSKQQEIQSWRKLLNQWRANLLRFSKSQAFEVGFILLLLAIASFLRFYKIQDTVMFLGDQGRDALVVSRIFKQADLAFIGPVTSVGNMYLGPVYYYFMLPWLWLSYPSPMGPVYAVAAVGVLSVFLLYWLGKRIFGRLIAGLAAILLAFNATGIFLSRFSWNPNPEPLISILWLYSLIRAYQGKYWHWALVGLWLAVLLQLHYVTLIAVIVSGMVWLYQFIKLWRQHSLQSIWLPTVFGAIILIGFFLPLILFDIKHNWLNANSFVAILRGDDAFAVAQSLGTRVQQIIGLMRARSAQIMIELFLGESLSTGVLLSTLMLGASAVFLIKEKSQPIFQGIFIILLTIMTSILVLSIYKNDVYIHYIAFLLPLVCLLYAYVLRKLANFTFTQVVVIGVFIIFYSIGNVSQLRWQPSGPTLRQLSAVSDFIHQQLDPNEKYALLLLSQTKDNYGMNYRYFLSTDENKSPLDPENLADARTLIVVQEDLTLENPLSLPLYELLVFNVATPSAKWQIPDGPIIYKLEKTAPTSSQIGNEGLSGV